MMRRSALLFLTFLLPAAAREPSMLVSSKWLATHLNDPGVVVLHVARERAHYDGGHVPGACFLPFGEMTATRDGIPVELPPAAQLVKLFEGCGVRPESRIVLYGDSFNLSATRAYFTLDYLGLADRAALLDGGLEQWQAEKRPLSKESPAARQGRVVPRIRPEVLVALPQVRDLSWAAGQGRALLVDTRPPDDYKADHIPGAVNQFWMDHLVSKANPVFRPKAELRRIYEKLSARTGSEITVYCRSGVQATHSYFTLKYLGYKPRLYDGSMSEWTKAGR